MLKNRVIPVLLLSGDRLIKTLRFKDPKYVGDPINAIRIFNDKEVDELIVLDVMASKSRREPNYALIEKFAGECFMPLAYGGGIRSVEQARQLFSMGIEKVCVQTSIIDNPRLISELSEKFGSQSVVVSLDVKRNWCGKRKYYSFSKRSYIDGDWQMILKKFVQLGAGEILLNSVDKDGTLSGPDLKLISDAAQSIEVPLIALGGIATLGDIKNVINAGASAAAAGSFFVFHGPHRAVLITYPNYKELEKLLSYDS